MIIAVVLPSLVFAQKYKGVDENKASKMVNLRKMVKVYKKQSPKLLVKNGFVQDSTDSVLWVNNETGEMYEYDSDYMVFTFTDGMISNKFDNGRNKVGMILQRMWLRRSWHNADVISYGEKLTGIDVVRVKGEWLALVVYEDYCEVFLIDMSKN